MLMAIGLAYFFGKKLLVYSVGDPSAPNQSPEACSTRRANELTAMLGCRCEPVRSADELRGRMERGDAETVILELAKPVEGQHRSLDEYMAEVNSLILAWAKVRKLRGK